MGVGERVRKLRKGLNLTQKEFAAKVGGGDYTYVGKIERSEQWPSLKFLSRIALAHGKPLSYFFEDSEKPDTRAADLRRSKVKTLICLVSRFDWRLADFRACRRACTAVAICKVVRTLVDH